MAFQLACSKRFTCWKYYVLFLCFICLLIIISNELLDPCNYTIAKGMRSFSSKLNCHLAQNFLNKALYTDVEVVGTDQRTSEPSNKAKYILVMPRATSCISCTKDTCHGVRHLVNILESWSDFDGATCGNNKDHSVFNTSIKACRFFTKHWSVVIQESGELQTRQMSGHLLSFFNCNIIEAPFLIRRNVFNGLGLKPSLGEATLIDFFLRSNGALKIASSINCSFTDEQLATDRGAMETKQIYLDYGLLGFNHNILRVIREDSITWTQCSRDSYFCPNKPLQEIGNSTSKKLSFFCCDEALNQYLIDAVDGLVRAGTDYRLTRGTLLGAVRSKNIIPWTRDIDIDLTLKDYKDPYAFIRLQKIMQRKHYSTPLIYQLRRIMPLFPLKTQLPGIFNHDLFSKTIVEQMKGVLPIIRPQWNSMGYVDIYSYEGPKTSPTNVTINGRSYKTHSNPEAYLEKAFGNSWREFHHGKRSKEPHKPWLWKLDTSLVQEDVPTPKEYCGLHQTSSVVILGIASFPFIICTFISVVVKYTKRMMF